MESSHAQMWPGSAELWELVPTTAVDMVPVEEQHATVGLVIPEPIALNSFEIMNHHIKSFIPKFHYIYLSGINLVAYNYFEQ